MKIVQTTSLIPVIQHVDGFEPTEIESESMTGLSSRDEYFIRRKQLVGAFGNKKSKQILKQSESAVIEAGTVIGGKAMETILKMKAENVDMKNVIMKKPKKSTAAKKAQEKKETNAKKSKK